MNSMLQYAVKFYTRLKMIAKFAFTNTCIEIKNSLGIWKSRPNRNKQMCTRVFFSVYTFQKMSDNIKFLMSKL